MSIFNLTAIKQFVKGNTTALDGTARVSVVFDTVTTATTASTSTISVAAASGTALAVPVGFAEVLVGGVIRKVPFYKD